MERERTTMHPKYDGRTGEVTLRGNPIEMRFENLTGFYRFWAWHEECDVQMELYNTGRELMATIKHQTSRMRDALHA